MENRLRLDPLRIEHEHRFADHEHEGFANSPWPLWRATGGRGFLTENGPLLSEKEHMARGLSTLSIATLAISWAFAIGCVAEPQPFEGPFASFAPHGPLSSTNAVDTLTRVTSGSDDELFPALSPDGTTLLFVSGWFYPDYGIAETRLIGLDMLGDTRRTAWVEGVSFVLTPAWLPDGASYVFATEAGSGWSLVRTREALPAPSFDVIVDGNASSAPLNPSIAPDGTRLAFSVLDHGVRHIAVADIDGSNLKVLHEGDYPSWSPTSDAIVFQRMDTRDATHLFRASVDAPGSAIQLTWGEASDVHPSYSPDGRQIVFGSTRGHEQRRCKACCNLWKVDDEGGEPTKLAGGDVDADWPSWGADGWVYFVSNERGNYDVWRLRLRGEVPEGRVPATPGQGGS